MGWCPPVPMMALVVPPVPMMALVVPPVPMMAFDMADLLVAPVPMMALVVPPVPMIAFGETVLMVADLACAPPSGAIDPAIASAAAIATDKLVNSDPFVVILVIPNLNRLAKLRIQAGPTFCRPAGQTCKRPAQLSPVAECRS